MVAAARGWRSSPAVTTPAHTIAPLQPRRAMPRSGEFDLREHQNRVRRPVRQPRWRTAWHRTARRCGTLAGAGGAS
jgi:hypothetical protein